MIPIYIMAMAMVLLDVTDQELSFSVWNAGVIVTGIVTVAGNFFWFKAKVAQLESDHARDKEQNDKDLEAIRKDITDNEDTQHKRVDSLRTSMNEQHNKLERKIDKMQASISDMPEKIINALTPLINKP